MCVVGSVCADLSRSPEYFSMATSFGRAGRDCVCRAVDEAAAIFVWEDGGERDALLTLLLVSTGRNVLPIFISTNGTRSTEEAEKEVTNQDPTFTNHITAFNQESEGSSSYL